MFYEGEGALIKVGDKEYHSYRDLDMILSNLNIGTPKQKTSYISIPGRHGNLDMSEDLTGHIVYESRQIDVTFENVKTDRNWDGIISNYRNMLDGKTIKVTFDNDKAYYWIGRCSVADFERNWNLGKFVLTIPEADPYKYELDDSTEPWKWDTFSFETGVIKPIIKNVTVSGMAEYTIPAGHMPTVPKIIVTLEEGQAMQVAFHNRGFDLINGSNRIPSIVINGDTDETLIFTGDGEITIQYRGGSL